MWFRVARNLRGGLLDDLKTQDMKLETGQWTQTCTIKKNDSRLLRVMRVLMIKTIKFAQVSMG